MQQNTYGPQLIAKGICKLKWLDQRHAIIVEVCSQDLFEAHLGHLCSDSFLIGENSDTIAN